MCRLFRLLLRQNQFGNRCQHLRGLKGFNHPSLGACRLTFLFFGFLRFGSQHDHRREFVGGQFFDFFDKGYAVHIGHVDVGNDEMDFLPVQLAESVLAVRRLR